MKHLTKVGRSSKLIQRKFVRVGEGTLIYNIGRNRFIEMARAAGAVYKVGNSKGSKVLVNKEDTDRSRKYKDITDRETKNVRNRRKKTVVTVFVLLAVAIAAVLGLMKFNNYQKEMISQVQTQLIGNTFIAHDSHMEGFGWIHHEYWQLTFKDEENLDYAYIETVGPREDNEKPSYKGTYNYTLSRSIFGKYTVRVNGTTYKLNVNDSDVPTGISR